MFEKPKGRKFRSSLAIALSIMIFFGGVAFAADPQLITSSAAGINYFVYTNGSGSTVSLDRRDHNLVSNGAVAYCMEAGASSPHEYNSYNSGIEVTAYYGERIALGLEIIMFYGYPTESAGENGLSDRQARYATQVAISCWLAENGISQGSNFYNLTSSNNLRSNGTAEGNACWNYMMELLNDARSQAAPTHTAELNPVGKTTTSGGYFVQQYSVSLVNCNGGYNTITNELPAGSVIDGYTCSNGDTLTVRVPVSGNAGKSFRFGITGYDTRSRMNLIAQDASSSSIQTVFYSIGISQPVTAMGLVSGSRSTTVMDTSLFGQIIVTKVDSLTGGGAQGDASFAGVQFQITSNNGYNATITTNASGIATSDANLPVPDSYTVTEIAPPNGYLTASPQQVVFLATDAPDGNGVIQKNVTVFETAMTGQITVTKTDAETGSSASGGRTFAGTQFRITGPNGYDQTITADASGIARTSTGLSLGNYLVKETAVPSGYTVNPNPSVVTISASSPVSNGYLQASTTISNVPTHGQILVRKVDAVTGGAARGGASFSGVQFRITGANGYNNIITTDESGVAVTNGDLPIPGTYIVTEIAAPAGYLTAAPQTVVFLTSDVADAGGIVLKRLLAAETPMTGQITVTKTDSETGGTASGGRTFVGTQFRITGPNGYNQTVTANASGIAKTGTNLAFGTYTITETSVTSGYTINSNPVNVTISATSPVSNGYLQASATISNAPTKGQITVQKVDATTGGGARGGASFGNVQFRITSTTGYDKTITTDANGIAVTNTDLPIPGIYTVTEIAAPNGYLLATPQTVEFTVSDLAGVSGVVQKTANAAETPMTGQITITKTDAETGITASGGRTFFGTQFRVTGPNGYDQTITADASGVAKTGTDLDFGIYTIQETSVTDGYMLNKTSATVEISANSPVFDGYLQGSATISNTPTKGQIVVQKVDAKTGGSARGGASFAGIEFQITSDNGYSAIITTDESGIAVSASDLPIPGTYTVTEVAAPNGYFLADPDTVIFNIPDTANADGVVVKNILAEETPIPGHITITKEDVETGAVPQGAAVLSGAQFRITGPNEYDQIVVTNTSGIAETGSNLDFGEYTITEISAPTGYTQNSNSYSLTISANSPVESGVLQEAVTITDKIIRGNVSIHKTAYNQIDEEAVPEPEATFEIYSTMYDDYDTTPEDLRDMIVIGEDGNGISKDLPYGTYRIVQTEGKEGYIFVPSWTVMIAEDGKTYAFDRVNPIKASALHITKKDIGSGNAVPVPGTEFQIYHAATDKLVTQTINYPSPTVLSSFVADETGTITLPQLLAYGRYYLVEVNAPTGYLLDTQRIYFDVTGEESTVEVSQSNYPAQGTITIEKTGMAFTGTQTKDITYGNQKVSVTAPVFTEKPLSNATFTITAANDIYTADGTLRAAEGTIVATLTTDETGTVLSNVLYLGQYYVQETKAPEGYVLDTAKHEVVLTYKDQDTAIVNETVSLENAWQKTYANIHKEVEAYVYNQDGSKNVAGTVQVNPGEGYLFGLYAADDIPLDSTVVITKDTLINAGVTDKNGELSFDSYVPHGKYYVKELSTDSKFLLNDSKYPIDFSYQGQDTASIKLTANPDAGMILNKLDQKEMKLKKTDLTGTVPLAGCTIEVYDASGTLVFRNVTNANGEIAFKVTPGTYTFKETIAPDGYSINTAVFTFTVAKDGSVTGDTTVTDAPLPKTGLEVMGVKPFAAFAMGTGVILLGGCGIVTPILLKRRKRIQK